MKNDDKQQLARFVKAEIERGTSKAATIEKLKGLGFKKRTIGVYYEGFNK